MSIAQHLEYHAPPRAAIAIVRTRQRIARAWRAAQPWLAGSALALAFLLAHAWMQ
jgi:hypothetical protein